MSNVWNIADRLAGPLDRECPDCDGTGWTDPHCDQVLADAAVVMDVVCTACRGTGRVALRAHDRLIDDADALPAEVSRTPVSDAAREKLHFVFFDALPGRQFRVMARNGSHAVTRIRQAYDFPVACLLRFCAYLAC